MQIILRTEECGNFVRFLPIQHLDPERREEAKNRFHTFQQQGVILGSRFEDDHWLLTNQIHTVTLDFHIDMDAYQSRAQDWVGCTAVCFLECMRAYIAFQLGTYTLEYLKEIVAGITLLSTMTAEDAKLFSADTRSQMIGFLSLIPAGNDMCDQVIEALETQKWCVRSSGPRKLPELSCFLRFDRALNEFWPLASESERKEYFPVYFWWKLTAILPLRCTEFLLTPRDCIRSKQGKCLLTIRRTRLKKGNRRLSYTVAQDYTLHEYEIPEWLFDAIRQYQKATQHEQLPELETLLVPSRSGTSGYFSYTQMLSCLKRFCREQLGNESYPIHLGDTRHIAMINLMLSGGSPVLCRELAGHESIDVSAHYYSNLSAIVESVVYERSRGWNECSVLDGALRFPAALPRERIRVEQGWCDAVGVANGDVSECLKCYGADREIGNCINCPHFYADSPGLRAQIVKRCKEAVDEDGRFVMQMIEQVRKGLGHEEEIAEALLRLQSSGYRYGMTLVRIQKEEQNDGKTQKE